MLYYNNCRQTAACSACAGHQLGLFSELKFIIGDLH